MKDGLLTNQVAQMYGVSPDTIRRLRRSGKLRAESVGHIRVFSIREVERVLGKRKGTDSKMNEAPSDNK